MLKQTAVYWSPIGSDDYCKTTFDTPIEIKVRWSEEVTVFTTPQGEQKTSRATIYVDRDVLVDGVLKLGVLGDVSNLTEPMQNEGAFVIAGGSKIPTMNAKQFLRIAYI